MTKASAPVLEVQQIPVAQIQPSATNPRKSIDPKQLEELAQSIQSVGIQVPLSLRILPGENGSRVFELVGGERRWRAAQIAGLPTVPAIAREMTDTECRDAQLIENLQREDLPPLDEADAYAGLVETLGSTQALAARVGKPIEYVTRRLKLRSLIDYSRQALADRLITIDHALLLAKLAPAEQEQALRWTLYKFVTRKQKTADLLDKARKGLRENVDEAQEIGSYWESQTVLELKRYIEDEIKLQLSRAPWDLSDAKLVESAGACISCPKNTAANNALFGDLAIEEATCTDSACFGAKKQAFVQIQLHACAAAGKDAVRISWKSSEAKPRWKKDGKGPDLGQVFRAGQWIVAKKGECEHVVQAIAIDDDVSPWRQDKSKKIGARLLVCVGGGCKKHRKTWEKTPAKRSTGGYDAQAEEEKRKRREAAVDAENKIRLELAQQALAKVTKFVPAALRLVVMEVVIQLRAARLWRDDSPLRKDLESAPIDGVAFARAVAALALELNGLELGNYEQPENNRKEFLATLKILGVDGSSAWKKKPEPKAKKSSPTSPEKPAKAKAAPAKKKGGKR